MARTKRTVNGGGATRSVQRWTRTRTAPPVVISKKRRDRSRKAGVGRKIKLLQELVPNGGESTGLDGLFREAANYIVCLQLQVKVMQTVLDELSPDI
ncbi:hypothetical protein Cni_G27915 [Canna indica]|uniref:Uncharacterized protein n=1 Tax=Canna indica TaxID=4628 RepID=A0AAQ3L5U1_9LILI|nr:hypothetical protein Cni_G27915 [Canna indica]